MTPASPDQVREPSNDWICRHYARIHRAAWVMTGDAWEAEDLAQETFAVALEKWKSFQGRSTDATWLFGILLKLRSRRERTLVRMKRRLQEYVDRNRNTKSSEDPQQALSEKRWKESVWASVARLPKPQRDAVTLRYAEGLSYDKIADIVGCPPGTAKTRVHHAIKRLRLDMGEEDRLQELPMMEATFDSVVECESERTTVS